MLPPRPLPDRLDISGTIATCLPFLFSLTRLRHLLTVCSTARNGTSTERHDSAYWRTFWSNQEGRNTPINCRPME